MARLKFRYIPCRKKKNDPSGSSRFAPRARFLHQPQPRFFTKPSGLGGFEWARNHTAKLARNLAWMAYTTFRANFRAATLTKKLNLHRRGGFTVFGRAFSNTKNCQICTKTFFFLTNTCERNDTVKLARECTESRE